MPTIHLHIGKQHHVVHYPQRTKDAGSLRAQYDDLLTRMMKALVATVATKDARTVDDKVGAQEGHEFHGNQHTGGIPGTKKTKPEHVLHVKAQLMNKSLKSAKAAVHALLSSGHPFSKDELAIAVGMDPAGKTINDYLTNLKNPNFAGPQGALKIEKNKDGMFFVAMPDGTPAPPPTQKLDLSQQIKKIKEPDEHDDELLESAKVEGLKLAGLSDAQIAKVMGTPAVPQPHTPEPSHTNEWDKHMALLKGPPPGTVTKAAADEAYKAAQDEALNMLKGNLKAGLPAQAALLQWKTQRAHAMAAWGTAVHGHAFAPAKQQVFKADEQLAKDIMDFSMAAAMGNWKSNTAGEKAGTWPAKPKPVIAAAVKPAPVVSAATHAAVDMGHPAYVPPIDYHTLRPASHVDIDEDDILSGKFKKGILKLKKDLVKESISAQGNKKSVEEKLRARLKDAPNFQALNKRMGMDQSGPGSLESKLIQAWAGSSGDTHDISVALQMAVRDAFEIPDSHIEKKALKSLDKHGNDLDKLVSSAIKDLAPYGSSAKNNPLKPHEIATTREALKEFVQAQYHETQEHLKSLGHDHVFVVRGMHLKINHDYTAPAAVKLQPASSFSADWETSRGGFAGSGGTMFVAKIPRQQVLSTYMTGFGCTGEHEVVVMAHDKLKAYTTPGDGYAVGTSATAAQAFLQNKLKEANPALKNVKTAPIDYGDE